MVSNSNQRSSSSGLSNSKRRSNNKRTQSTQSVKRGSASTAVGLSQNKSDYSRYKNQSDRTPKNSYRKSTRSGRSSKYSKGSKLKKILVTLVVLVVALGITYGVLANTDVFEIEAVEVEGTSRISDEVLTKMVALPQGTNLLNVDTASIVSRLQQNPWIESVNVKRSFPHTLVLEIQETTPAALVQIDPSTALGSTTYWLISSDGIWMSQVSSTGVEQARELVVSGEAAAALAEQQAAEEAANTQDSADDQSSDNADDSDDSSTDETTDDQSQDADDTTDSSSDDSVDAGDDSATDDEVVDEDADSTSDDSTDDADEDTDSTEESQDPSVCTDVYFTVAELAQVTFITGTATGLSPEQGVQETDEGVINALEILQEADSEFKGQISSITSASDDTTSITLISGVEIAFGKAENIQAKINVVKSILEQYPDEISYINVRIVDRPSWRTV